MGSIDQRLDLHTHSDITDGADTPEAMADAAVAAGLHTWGLSDHVRATSDWLPDYVARVRAIRRPDLSVRCGCETKMLDRSGRLDLPSELPQLDYLLIADHQFPSVGGPITPSAVAEELRAGRLSPGAVVDHLVEASAAALTRSPFPPILVHPFSLLPKVGVREDEVGIDHVTALAAACAASGGAVEINEKWRCPSPRVVELLMRLSVPLVLGSDAHSCAAVAAWDYCTTTLAVASAPAVAFAPAASVR